MICIVLYILILNVIKGIIISSAKYDYIVVGAGTAGSVVAAQLSVDPRNKVLLIEEGGWSSIWGDLIEDASNYWKVLNNLQIERGYLSTPQCNVNNRELPLYRAKITGGCGAHYGMCWTLGNKKDFDEGFNFDNWRWNDLSKHWDSIQETFEINTIKSDEFTDRFFKAAKENGYDFNPNYNDLNNDNGQYGASKFQYSAALKTKNNEIYALRQNSWTQYIEPIISQRNNLDIIVYNRVDRILFAEFNKTTNIKPIAIGVETTNIGMNRKYKFYASKEVILSGGTFDSPKILLLSGIGDCNKHKLKKCVVDLDGVGKSLQEHIYFLIESPPIKKDHPLVTNVTLPPFIFATDFRVIMYDQDDEFEFIFVVDSKHKMDLKYVDNFPLDKNLKQKAETIQIFVLPLHLKSRGFVELKDDNPASDPLININFLSDKYDEKLLIRGVKKARKLLYADSLIDLYENIDDEILPGSNIQSDEEIIEWIKTVLLTDYHSIGTNKMGSVVDNRLRVVGVEHLRVIDASIIPNIVSAHTNAATTLIALKASDIILDDNNNNKHKTEL